MLSVQKANLEMIKKTAQYFGDLLNDVVFLGGATTGLFITDPGAPEIRATSDVDVITEISSRIEYYKLEERLRALGFKQRMEKDSSYMPLDN